MTTYLYKAIDENGSTITGQIDAVSSQVALEMLANQGHIPESVKPKSSQSDYSGILTRLLNASRGTNSTDLVLYTKQFKTLLQAGVSILQIFQILEIQSENKILKNVSAVMMKDIREGVSLFKAFSTHKRTFSHLYCAMIKAGEETGSLSQVMERLIYIMEHEEKVKRDIESAIRYPLIVLGFLGIAFMVLLTFVVPKFVTIFERAGIDLPMPTKICMVLYSILTQDWLYILIFTGIAIGKSALCPLNIP